MLVHSQNGNNRKRSKRLPFQTLRCLVTNKTVRAFIMFAISFVRKSKFSAFVCHTEMHIGWNRISSVKNILLVKLRGEREPDCERFAFFLTRLGTRLVKEIFLFYPKTKRYNMYYMQQQYNLYSFRTCSVTSYLIAGRKSEHNSTTSHKNGRQNDRNSVSWKLRCTSISDNIFTKVSSVLCMPPNNY